MPRHTRRRTITVGLLGFLSSAAINGAHAGWLDDDGNSRGCHLVPDDFRPAWLCFIAATGPAPGEAARGPGHARAPLVTATATSAAGRTTQ